MQVELIALDPVQDVFNYLPPGGIAMICLSSPINLCYPQHATSLQPRINVQAHCQMSHSLDGCRSQIVGCGVGIGQHPVLNH